MRHVIIGNSAAAIGCVEGIRHHDQESAITIVADEPHHTYSRPLISYLLGGLVDESRMSYRPADFYESNRVETMLGVEVTEVAPQQRVISLAGGGTLPYDRLLIATGGKPFVPPVAGSDLQGVFTFGTWDDARRIGRYIDEVHVKSALVIGAGLIGLKTIEALLARGDSGYGRGARGPGAEHHLRSHGLETGRDYPASRRCGDQDQDNGDGNHRSRWAGRSRAAQ